MNVLCVIMIALIESFTCPIDSFRASRSVFTNEKIGLFLILLSLISQYASICERLNFLWSKVIFTHSCSRFLCQGLSALNKVEENMGACSE